MPAMQNAGRPPWFSIALLSMSALAYEILLMRLFSIIQWHHFAYMIISLALLGYGASGTFLAIFRNVLLPRYRVVYAGNIILFAVSMLCCFLISQQLKFNAEEILWDFQQSFILMAMYLLLALPFFFVASAIGLTFSYYRTEITRIYAADLLGAGCGGLVVVLLLYTVPPAQALVLLAASAWLIAALALWELSGYSAWRLQRLWPLMLAGILLPFVLPASWYQPELSPYKGLSQTLWVKGAIVALQRSSPLGLITVVENPAVPFRHAPGLSLKANQEPPEQVGVFVDGDGMTVISRDTGNQQAFSYLDQLTSALPYHLSTMEHVLVAGAGGGAEVLQARYHNAGRISALELNTQIVDLLRRDYRDFSGGLYNKNNVEIITEEARGFIAGSDQRYDLVQFVRFDSFGASSAGLYALNENYLYTVEALQEYIAHLQPGGYLAISQWINIPPRDTLKLFATAVDALKRSGVEQPEQQLMLVRGLQTATLLIKNAAITKKDIAALKKFCSQRLFDTAYYPGMPPDEANRHNVLAQPYFYNGAVALLGERRDDFLERYKFDLRPATDDRPFFSHFFRWRILPEIVSLMGEGGMPLMQWGYLILIATFIQALVVSMVLILLPLLFLKDKAGTSAATVKRSNVFIYFISIGLAFLFIEIAFIQKFILLLHHPIFAIAVVLTAFLIFAGFGSLWAKKLADTGRYARGVTTAVIIIAVISVSYLWLLGPLFSQLIALPVVARIALALALIAPLAFCMGMPFSLGMARLAEITPALVPWAWGVNGCASVLSAVLATLMAIHTGFSWVVLAAVVLYGVTVYSSARWMPRQEAGGQTPAQ